MALCSNLPRPLPPTVEVLMLITLNYIDHSLTMPQEDEHCLCVTSPSSPHLQAHPEATGESTHTPSMPILRDDGTKLLRFRAMYGDGFRLRTVLPPLLYMLLSLLPLC
jgi:hypothetical protein